MKKAFFITLLSVMAAVCCSIRAYAECDLKTDEFRWNDSYNEMISEVNDCYITMGINEKLEKKKVIDNEYAVMYILNDNISLADYSQGNIVDFIKENSARRIEHFYYLTDKYTDYYTRISDGISVLENRMANKSENTYDTVSLTNAADKISRYADITGEVAFVRYAPLYLAIVSQNGIPEYVVVLDNVYYSNEMPYNSNENAKAIIGTFSRLYSRENGQNVFDFDFFHNLIKAKENKLENSLLC